MVPTDSLEPDSCLEKGELLLSSQEGLVLEPLSCSVSHAVVGANIVAVSRRESIDMLGSTLVSLDAAYWREPTPAQPVGRSRSPERQPPPR